MWAATKESLPQYFNGITTWFYPLSTSPPLQILQGRAIVPHRTIYIQKARQLRKTSPNPRWISSDIRDGMAAHANAKPTGSRMLQQVSSNTKISTNARKRDFTEYKDYTDEIPCPQNTKRAGQSVSDPREPGVRKPRSI
ncbi:hypothetical protein JMJ35_004868 [Cladonia borealis]|uniref:Uncharacterized protein n=1 Tax=Cladonia borealis TaxID=184061 RepID=A0AA39R2J9_9LECA|nr:hypothetical protein JMJ35_004868 [Cladonia borealis]